MPYRIQLRPTFYEWPDLKTVMARATPLRSGDVLAGIAASTAQERVAAQMCLAQVPLARFLEEHLIPPENDEVTRLILETHDKAAFEPVKNLTVGKFRNWLLRYETDASTLSQLAPGLTPEMVAAVSKICALQDLVLIAQKCRVVTGFRDTIGLEGRLSVRLQPNHPTDDPRGILAATLDGLLMGCGDAVIGVNPATDSPAAIETLLRLLDELISGFQIPTQSCVLGHVTTTLGLIERGVPVDLVFQSIAGTQAANASFGVHLGLLDEALDAARSLKRGTVGENVMYFETGQGSCLSANAHFGVDQQTLEARAYAVARRYQPLLVNTVVGFIGPEYLYDGKQITRAGLEDHFCGKLLGVPMGCDVCYTNHAEADQDDMDALMTLLGVAGLNFMMGVPGADDIMLGYQSTSFHDAQFLRQTLRKKPAPEFEAWLQERGVTDGQGKIQPLEKAAPRLGTPEALLPVKGSSTNAVALKDTWKTATPARLALERAGASLATNERLDFQLDHANARDAVHWPFDASAFAETLKERGWAALVLESQAPLRGDYLQRPDWGRQLSPKSRAELEKYAGNYDLVICFSDGLSALAVQRHALLLWEALFPYMEEQKWKLAPLCVVRGGRVAIEDEIGQVLGARAALMLIGERPGLLTPDSLSAYFVYEPRIGNTDERRNCISNIRPEGFPLTSAAQKLAYLLREMFTRQLSGISLKDEGLTPILSS